MTMRLLHTYTISNNITALDRMLNDVCVTGTTAFHFGNIPVVFGGNFAQILRIVRNGNRGAIVNACIQHCTLWPGFSQLRLTQNMQIMTGDSDAEFAKFLSSMSYSPEMCCTIKPPPFIRCLHSVDSFLDQLFPADVLNGAHLNSVGHEPAQAEPRPLLEHAQLEAPPGSKARAG